MRLIIFIVYIIPITLIAQDFSGQGGTGSNTAVEKTKSSRVTVMAGNISNNAINNINFSGTTYDENSLTVAGNQITIAESGVYDIFLLLNFFDNNSARVAHRVNLLINGVPYSSVEGESIRHIDGFVSNSGDVITYTIQSHSSTANTSAITSGWLIINKK